MRLHEKPAFPRGSKFHKPIAHETCRQGSFDWLGSVLGEEVGLFRSTYPRRHY